MGLWEFAFNAGLHLDIHHAQIHLSRQFDAPLMITFAKMRQGRDMRALNKVRLYHDVTTIADISTADGTQIDPTFLSSGQSTSRRNDFKWPEKHEIKPADLALWRKAIKSLCALQLHLSVPLERWKTRQSDWTLNWNWFSSTTADKIFHQNKDGIWTDYAIKEGR